jgi:hypothetical protein
MKEYDRRKATRKEYETKIFGRIGSLNEKNKRNFRELLFFEIENILRKFNEKKIVAKEFEIRYETLWEILRDTLKDFKPSLLHRVLKPSLSRKLDFNGEVMRINLHHRSIFSKEEIDILDGLYSDCDMYCGDIELFEKGDLTEEDLRKSVKEALRKLMREPK